MDNQQLDPKRAVSLDRIIDLVGSTIESKMSQLDKVAKKVDEMEEILVNISQLQNEISKLQTQVVAKDLVIQTLEKNNERFINENFDYKMKQKSIEERLANSSVEELESVKTHYKQLLQFCFENIGPTVFDPMEAKFHWEKLVK